MPSRLSPGLRLGCGLKHGRSHGDRRHAALTRASARVWVETTEAAEAADETSLLSPGLRLGCGLKLWLAGLAMGTAQASHPGLGSGVG